MCADPSNYLHKEPKCLFGLSYWRFYSFLMIMGAVWVSVVSYLIFVRGVNVRVAPFVLPIVGYFFLLYRWISIYVIKRRIEALALETKNELDAYVSYKDEKMRRYIAQMLEMRSSENQEALNGFVEWGIVSVITASKLQETLSYLDGRFQENSESEH